MALSWRRLPRLGLRWRSFSSGFVSLDSAGPSLAKLTLRRPEKLNSLSLPMIHDLRQIYHELPQALRVLLLDGEGRALCAGGDVAEVRQGVLDGTSYPADFFYDEYELDYQIATLFERKKIVQVALWDGIVMGGGVGLSIHSPIRVCTEKTLFAMPETGIGLFPDVGATWALTRLKAGAHVGLMLGLTGERLGAADCLHSGLATHFCPSEKLPELEAKLKSCDSLQAAEEVISQVAAGAQPDTAKAHLAADDGLLQRCFNATSTAEGVVAELKAAKTERAEKILKTLLSKSPLSVKVSLEALRRHQSVTLREAFIVEYRLSQKFMRPAPWSDFCEGIRAVLVDKDQKPQWQPPSLEEVTDTQVEEFFTPLPSDHPRGDLAI